MSLIDNVFVLNQLYTLLAGCLMLVAGTVLAQRVGVLARYSIPAPIIGGLLFAILAALLGFFSHHSVAIEDTARSTLLLLFFATIGLSADLALLRSGGTRLLRFLVILFPFLMVQNALGVGVAWLIGLHPVVGLAAGSITLVGGHGTGAAYATQFAERHGIPGIMELTMTSATLGLVLGGIVGGPVARHLVNRISRPAVGSEQEGGVVSGPVPNPVTMHAVVLVLSLALIAVIGGRYLAGLVEGGAITIPGFLWCLLIGLAIRNIGPLVGLHLHQAATELLGSICLSIFLVWTMMALDLHGVLLLAGPLLVILAAQTVLVALWAIFICFPAAGRDYEAAVLSGAFCGFAMGATATAIANMQAVAQKFGPAPQAFVIVPVVGAFFVDLMNIVVLTGFLSLSFLAG